MTVVRTESGIAVSRRSPLAHRHDELRAHSASGRVELAEEPFLTQVNVRVRPESPAVVRIEQALGLRWPYQPGTVTGDDDRAVLWLGPDERLVVAPDGEADAIVSRTRTAVGVALGSTVDVSANRTTLRLGGPLSREAVEKWCSIDLHPRAFGPGQCAQTLVGRTQAILWQISDQPEYRLLVRCSFANYLADILLDAMAEFT